MGDVHLRDGVLAVPHALEVEKYDPSLPLAFKIARLFDRPVEEIFDPDGVR